MSKENDYQGAPVTLPKRKMHHLDPSFLSESEKGWNACLDEIAKLGPLYTHPVQREPVAYLCKSEGSKWLQYGSKVGDPWKPGEVEVTPLYAHADVETMRRKNNEYWHETEVLRAHLGIETARVAEAHALLRDAHEELVCRNSPVAKRIDAALSASAEQLD